MPIILKVLDRGFDLGNSQTPITPLIVKDEALAIEFSKNYLIMVSLHRRLFSQLFT